MTDSCVVDPRAVDMNPAKIDLLVNRVRIEVESGRLPSAQVAVARHGKLVAFETLGAATPAHRYILQSVGRGVVAGVVWKLLGEGLLDVAERVGDVIPEFATNGKEGIIIEQVLTHTAGFPFAPLGFPKMRDRASRLEAMAKWRLTFEPGAQLQWHLTSAAWVIAELIERRTGLSFADYLAREVAGPLGLTLEVGVPLERQRETIAWPEAIDRTSDDQEVDPWGPWYLVNPDILAAGEPSHSMVGTAADLAMFYQALFHSGRWAAHAVADGTRVRVSAPPVGEQIYGGGVAPVNMALFVTVRGDDGGGQWMPVTASPSTFGSGGAPCQLAFIDPDSGVSFAFLTNGYPLAGYDYTREGVNLKILVGALAGDLA